MDGATVALDATLLGDEAWSTLRLGALYQFIGECVPASSTGPSPCPLVRVRVFRCVDGLDTDLYYRALALQRQHLLGQPK